MAALRFVNVSEEVMNTMEDNSIPLLVYDLLHLIVIISFV